MLPSFATVQNVEGVWGELTTEDRKKVTAWIATASNNLRLAARKRGVDIDTFIAGDDMRAQAAQDAVVEAVRRRLMNPEGIRQRSRTETGGPYSETVSETIDSAVSAGGLYFTADELAWLPAAQRNRLRSFRVRAGLRS